MRILDCSTVETTIKSLSDLLKTKEKNINSFIDSNKYRITKKDKCWYYDNIYIEDVLIHFNLKEEQILPDKLLMFHLTTGIDHSSYQENGILNLESLIQNQLLSDFFANSGVQIDYEEGSPPTIRFNGKEFKDEMLFHRFKQDNCINGFLIKEDSENNPNVKHIIECPEFIWDISKLINNPELVSKWKETAITMKLSLLVNFTDVDYYEPLGYVLKAIEYVLFKNTGYWDPSQNFMVFLKGNVCVPPENIIEIEELY